MASVNTFSKRSEVLVANTWFCNLRCTYCFVQKNELAKEDLHMTPEMAIRVIDALDEGLGDKVGTITVHLYGGEPFTHLPSVRAMVDRGLQKKPGRIGFTVTTNGTVLNDEVIELLNRGKFGIVLSIDGPAEIHDRCRRKINGAATHAHVIRFLETIREKTSCLVTGSSVIRSGWSLRQATEYLRTLPIHSIKAQAVRAPQGAPFGLTPEERQQYMDDLEFIGRRVIRELEENKFPMDNRYAARVLQLLRGSQRTDFCGAGETTFGITPEGKVLPCILLDDHRYYLGHIDDDPKTWVEAGMNWKGEPLRPDCNSCPHLQLCGGGCPAMYSVCAEDECQLVSKNCEVAHMIYDHFVEQGRPEDLLGLAGIK